MGGCSTGERENDATGGDDSIFGRVEVADAPAMRDAVDAVAPLLTIDGFDEIAIEPAESSGGSQALVWKLRGRAVKSFTVKLVGFRDGKPAPEIDVQVECELSEASSTGEFAANLVYSVVRGDAFGQVGRRMASLQIDFKTGGSSLTIWRNRQCTFDLADLPPAAEMRSHGGDVSRDEGELLSFSSYLPPSNERRYAVSDLADLAALSRGGGLTWGAAVEWKANGE